MNDEENSLNELLGEAVAAVEKTVPLSVETPAASAPQPSQASIPPRIDGAPEGTHGEPVADLEFEEALDDALDSGSAAAATEDPLQAMRVEQQKLSQKNDELSARHMRLMADFDNFRKRNARERATERRYASEPVLRELLEVVDNMDRAISAGADNPKLLSEGVGMIRNQLISLLSRFGATPFESVGGSFDPELQEAVANIPDARAEGEVIEELQKGYRFHDRILRAARVVVSAGNPS